MSDFSKQSLAIYLRLMRAVKPYWFFLALGVFGTLASSGIDAGVAWGVKPLLDKGLVAREVHFLSLLPIWIIGIFVLRGIFCFVSDYFVTRVGRTVVMDFRQQVFSHMLKLPASFYDQQTPGKLLALIVYNIEQLAGATTEAFLTIISEGSLAVGLLIVMFVISWKLALLFMMVAPLVLWILSTTTHRLRKLSANVQNSVGEVTHIANECIDGYRVIRTFNGEQYEADRFSKATALNKFRELKTVVTNSLGNALIQIIIAIPIAGILYVAMMPSLLISVGAFGAMIAAILRIFTPLKRLVKINTTLQKGIAAAQSIFELLDREPEKDSGTRSLMKAKGKIEYLNVSFNYPGKPNLVLDDVSLVVRPGQMIALVGHSGGGKSTLVSLLPRFYDVLSGRILLDGVDIKDYYLADLRKQFAFVSQHVILFNDTIANNIAYGKFSKASTNEIMNAARAANIMDFIEQLPEGLNTGVGDQGLLLSGGQRQRIAIARAVLKNAPILILDEATSALDTESERCVQEALEKLMVDRTTLVIAHRLSTVERADNIIVLDHGKIVETGTHSELMKLSGYYAKLSGGLAEVPVA